MNSAWDAGIPVATENALPCYDREGYNRILESVKPRVNPDNRHAIFFTYLRLSPKLFEEHHLCEFMRFVRQLHGMFIARSLINVSPEFGGFALCIWILFAEPSCIYWTKCRPNLMIHLSDLSQEPVSSPICSHSRTSFHVSQITWLERRLNQGSNFLRCIT